jgi:hypothetical protein
MLHNIYIYICVCVFYSMSVVKGYEHMFELNSLAGCDLLVASCNQEITPCNLVVARCNHLLHD